MNNNLLLSAKPNIIPTRYPLPLLDPLPLKFVDQSEDCKNLTNRRAWQVKHTSKQTNKLIDYMTSGGSEAPTGG